MTSVFRKIVVSLTAVVILAAMVFVAAKYLCGVQSVWLERGAIVIESSPDGRLANPYREVTTVPLTIALGLGFVFVATVAVVIVIVALLSQTNRTNP